MNELRNKILKRDGFDDFDPQDIVDKARTRLLNSKKELKEIESLLAKVERIVNRSTDKDPMPIIKDIIKRSRSAAIQVGSIGGSLNRLRF